MSLKRIAFELSVAEYSFTGIETRPKLSESEAMARGIEDSKGRPQGRQRSAQEEAIFRLRAVLMPLRSRLKESFSLMVRRSRTFGG